MGTQDANHTTEAIIGAAIEVHRRLGPGLLESVYEACLCRELQLRNIQYLRQLSLPVNYKGIELESGYRLDLLVENQVVVEIKAVDALQPVHESEILTYLRLGGWHLGLLLNFYVPVLKQGIKRIVYHLPEQRVALEST